MSGLEEDNDKEGLCEHCGINQGDWCINPYHEDIDGEEIWQFICFDCYNALLADI